MHSRCRTASWARTLQSPAGTATTTLKDSNPNIEWKATLDQAEKIGMGTRQYVLKKV